MVARAVVRGSAEMATRPEGGDEAGALWAAEEHTVYGR